MIESGEREKTPRLFPITLIGFRMIDLFRLEEEKEELLTSQLLHSFNFVFTFIIILIYSMVFLTVKITQGSVAHLTLRTCSSLVRFRTLATVELH